MCEAIRSTASGVGGWGEVREYRLKGGVAMILYSFALGPRHARPQGVVLFCFPGPQKRTLLPESGPSRSCSSLLPLFRKTSAPPHTGPLARPWDGRKDPCSQRIQILNPVKGSSRPSSAVPVCVARCQPEDTIQNQFFFCLSLCFSR